VSDLPLSYIPSLLQAGLILEILYSFKIGLSGTMGGFFRKDTSVQFWEQLPRHKVTEGVDYS
jgi:hypothetical protein